ncbi:MAG: DUF2079 domain-containing protein [bacterium]|nr:DUF2079 domain-containing protein [bacterium]
MISAALIAQYGVGIAVSALAAACAFAFAVRSGRTVSRGFLVGAIAVVPVFLVIAQLLKYASLHMYVDLAHWLRLFRSIVETGVPTVMNQAFIVSGTAHYFSVHFVPLVYALAVPFALVPRAEMLLVVNVLLMASAAVPLALLAKHRTGDGRFALLIAALFLWYPTFQYTTLYEFEMLRLSIPALCWMLYAWERRRMTLVYLFAVLAVLVREEVGLTVGMFGVLLLVQRHYRHGIVLALGGFGAFGIITSVLMPMFRSGSYEHVALGAFGALGRTPLAVLIGMVTHPLRAMAIALHPEKLANLVMYGVPLLGIPLLAPAALLPTLPSVAIALLSASRTHSSYFLYYLSPAIPFIFWAFVCAWPRVIVIAEHRARGAYGADTVIHARGAIMVAVIVGMLGAQVFFGPSPLALQFWDTRFRPAPFRTQSFHWSAYHTDADQDALAAVIAVIPRDAIVSTQQYLMPRLAHGGGAMAYPQLESVDGTARAAFVLLDDTNHDLQSDSPAYVDAAMLDIVRQDRVHWERIAAQSSYALYRFRP